jgi:phenylacetate-CoA ligase
MIRRPALHSEALMAEQFEFAGRSSDILHLGESHYAAKPAYSALCDLLREAGLGDLDELAHAIQFQNDRNEKILRLLAAVDDPQAHSARLASLTGSERLRECFIQSLKRALPLFDQTEQQYRALERTAYRFEIRFVERESPEIHRTRVNKVPLIRDVF